MSEVKNILGKLKFWYEYFIESILRGKGVFSTY